MSPTTCCACDKPIQGEVIALGQRSYCAACYAKVIRNRRGLWWSSLAQVLLLIVFVVLVEVVVGAAKPQFQGPGLTLVGVILALVPAVLWLAFFYGLDYREPEPKQLVLGVFFLGALLAWAVGIPLIEDVFRAPEWLARTTLVHILGGIFVVGFTQQFLIYAAVRYTVYQAAEFDERVDGIIYTVAAALGYATVVNIAYVVRSGGVDLVSGMIRITVTALALASFGGLSGYFLGRCKFEDEPLWWMPVGLALASVLDGLFTYARGEITTTALSLAGGGYNPWPGLVLGAVVALLTFGALFYLILRIQRRGPQPGPASVAEGGE